MSERKHPSPSPWSSHLDRLLAHALASDLVSSDQLIAAVDASGAQQSEADGAADRLGEYLVSKGILTRWQREKLGNGQYKGFFLGQYKLLEVDPDFEAYHYFAEDLQTRRRVKLLVKPNQSLPGGIEYSVIE